MIRRLRPETRRAPERARPRRVTRRRGAAMLAGSLALALAVPLPAARESDRQAPASIEADRVEIERPSGVSRYFGDVVFEQGTLRITGERMTLRAPGGVVRHAEVHGERATIRQQTDAGQTVRARARNIVYDAETGVAILTGNAELLRGGDRFTAGRIEYRPDTGRIDATGGDGDERVRIRIQPDGNRETPEQGPEDETDGGTP